MFGVLTAVLVVLALGAYTMGGMHDRAATDALRTPSGPACAGCAPSAAGRVAGTGSQPAVAAGNLPGTSRNSPATPTGTPTAASGATPGRSSTPSPSASPSASASPSPVSTSGQSAAAQVLAVINQARAQAGLPAYMVSTGLQASSRAHTLVMAGGCGLSHLCPGEPALGDRITQAGVVWTSVGENIGEGGPQPDTAAGIAQMAVALTQDMLAEKPPDDGHRLNILSSSFRYIGITVLRDSAGTVWMTQDFSG